MIRSTLAVTTLVAMGLPVALAGLAARRRGGDLVEAAAESLLGLGAFLVALWYAATLGTVSIASIAVAGIAASLVAALGMGGRRAVAGSVGPWRSVLAVGLVIAVCCVVPFLPYGLERADGVHRLSMTDWEKHLMFTTELVAFDEVPPRNPYLRSSGSSPYYAGFQLLASLPARAAGGPGHAFAALMGLTLLTVVLLPAVAWTIARTLLPEDHRAATLAAIGATLLGGFDLVPLLLDSITGLMSVDGLPDSLSALREVVPSINPDYWLHHNERQFDPPYRNAIWAPQHLLGALTGLTSLTLLLRADRGNLPPRSAVLVGIGLVATAMLSAYTAIALGVGLAAVAVSDALHARRSGAGMPSVRWWVAGGTAVLAGLPFAAHLAASPSAGLTLALSAAGDWRNGAVFTSLLGDGMLSRLLDTPAILIVETGAIGVLGTIGLIRSADARCRRRIVVFVVAVLLVVVFLRPPIGGPNNLYPRGMTLVWLLLAPFAATALLRTPRSVAALLLAPCALYLPYAMIGATLEGALFWATPMADHEVARWVEDTTGDRTIVALHPEEAPVYFTYWARRAIVYDDERLALLFGATPDQVGEIRDALVSAYETTLPRGAATQFDRLGADQVVVRTDSRAARAWAASPCFITGYRSEQWLVVSPEPEACER